MITCSILSRRDFLDVRVERDQRQSDENGDHQLHAGARARVMDPSDFLLRSKIPL